jgi:hypothetical protein
MKHSYLPVLALLTIIYIAPGCSKEKNEAPPPKTKTQLVTQGTWKFQSATANGTDISAYPQIACFTDNEITMTATGSGTGTGVINEGAVSCSPSTAGPFTWNFQNSEAEIFISTPLVSGGTTVWTINSLNENNLVMQQTMTIPPNPPILVVLTFKH